VGVVLNAVQQSHLYGSYYYYQSYGQSDIRSDLKTGPKA